jgi:hypothetical protein
MNCRALAIVGLAASTLVLGACRRPAKNPDAETATGDQPRDHFVVVTGCLRPGITGSTFVLTTTRAEGDAEAATYQLLDKPSVALSSHAGEQVEVSGTVLAENVVATDGRVAEKPAKGTSGTPTVETRAQVDVRQLDVTAVKPTGIKCTP